MSRKQATGEFGLSSLTTVEVASRQPEVLLVPLGATEQHGPHLPLSVDTTIAAAWAHRVAERLGSRAVVAAALPYGASGEHQTFPGTLSIGHVALHLVVVELVRSASATFKRVVFLSGHAGNRQALDKAVEQLRYEGHDVHHMFPQWGESEVVDAHAGHSETSLMLFLAPTTVRTELAEPGNVRPLSAIIDTLQERGVAAASPNGVLGDPTTASPEIGKRLFDSLVDRTTTALNALDSKA